MLGRLRAQLETPIIQVVIGVLVIGVGGIGWTLTQTANFWFGIGFLAVAFVAAELLLWRLDIGLPWWVRISVCLMAAVLAGFLVPGLLQQYQQLHAKPLTPDDIATAVWDRAPKPKLTQESLPTTAIPPPGVAKTPKPAKSISRVSSVAPSPPFHWSAEDVKSSYTKELPYAIKVTLSTDHEMIAPSIDIICDSPIENGRVSVGYPDPTKGGEATMVTGAQNEGPDIYHFVLNSPVFTPDILVWVTLEAKQPFRVKNVRIKEQTPRSLSQTMVNSPGGIQAGGNVNITNESATRLLTPSEKAQFAAAMRGVTGGPVNIECSLAPGSKPCDVAEQMAGLLRNNGWKVTTQRIPSLLISGLSEHNELVGINFIVAAPNTPGAVELQGALRPVYGVVGAAINPNLPAPINLVFIGGRRP